MTGFQPKKVVLAAGGTGGHMFPAQALARELMSRNITVELITDKRGGGFGPDLPQVKTHAISAAGVAGASLVKKVKSALLLGLGYFQGAPSSGPLWRGYGCRLRWLSFRSHGAGSQPLETTHCGS